MNDFGLQLIESASRNEKKRFYELFDGLSSILYQNLRENFSKKDEKLYSETNKLIQELKRIKESQKLILKPKENLNANQLITKKIVIDSVDLKPKPIVHHTHTNSLGRNEKNIKNIRNIHQKNIVNKEEIDKTLIIKPVNSIKLSWEKNSPLNHPRTNSSYTGANKNGFKMFIFRKNPKFFLKKTLNSLETIWICQ